jgi:hypothetical protein
MIAWLALALAGAITLAIGLLIDPPQTYFSYLTAYTFGLGLALGALFLILIEHLIAATWFVVLRRAAEIIVSALPAFVVLFLPVALGVHWLYPWTHAATLDEHARSLVELKRSYLNLPFFFVRAAVYFVCWVTIAERARHYSLAQDADPSGAWDSRLRAFSPPALIVLSFTLAFAAIDWLMALEPTFFSTIFGLQLFAGAVLGALALIAVIVGRSFLAALDEAVTAEHASAVGKMIFTFAIFWAYTSFAQLLIVWIADIPDEAAWYITRARGSWLVLGLALGVGEFAVPFFVLLSYRLKRRRRVLTWIGALILLTHYLELYWIVMPAFHPTLARPHWLDASAAATVVGVAVACAIWRARDHAPIAVGDPELGASLRYLET